MIYNDIYIIKEETRAGCAWVSLVKQNIYSDSIAVPFCKQELSQINLWLCIL